MGYEKKSNTVWNGVNGYTEYNLSVFMPEGEEACQYCPCLKFDNDTNARRCKLTWEIIRYPDSMIGLECTLNKKEVAE